MDLNPISDEGHKTGAARHVSDASARALAFLAPPDQEMPSTSRSGNFYSLDTGLPDGSQPMAPLASSLMGQEEQGSTVSLHAQGGNGHGGFSTTGGLHSGADAGQGGSVHGGLPDFAQGGLTMSGHWGEIGGTAHATSLEMSPISVSAMFTPGASAPGASPLSAAITGSDTFVLNLGGGNDAAHLVASAPTNAPALLILPEATAAISVAPEAPAEAPLAGLAANGTTNSAIVLENQKQGVAREIWDAATSKNIEGFATDISVNHGSDISFKININTTPGNNIPYHVEIYRLGYYGGDGATLVTTLNGLHGSAQAQALTDARGVVDAGNWAVSTTWHTPADATSGVYLAKVVRDDTHESNQIPFIIRQDEARADGSHSDIVLQTSDTTWQAYNGWGGNNGKLGGNFYGGSNQTPIPTADPGPFGADRAYAVSYNRPILTRDGGGTASGPQDYLFGADFAAISYLEKNGYDVSYISGVDTDRLGASALLGHKAFLSVGHDEYWSGGQRANVEAARAAGVNLLFWGGNDVYWKTRYEKSIDSSATDYRTLVCYKETWANNSLTAGPQDYANIDPSDQWTGTWRDLRFTGAVDAQGHPIAAGAKPENALLGTIFAGDGGVPNVGMDVSAALGGLRVWRDTSVSAGGVNDLAPGIIGYEWNTVAEDAYRPAGLIRLSNTLVTDPDILIDQGNRTAPGTGTHSLTLYRDAASGALVFSAGTVFWSWGLSNEHDNGPYGATIANTAVQQFTMNLFADMGIQPGVADLVLASEGLVRATKSTDTVSAKAFMNAFPNTVEALKSYTLTGTATDDDGNAATADGKVALVEVSLDNGVTWNPATGLSNWTYTWTPATTGTYNVLVRAIDDSLNLPSNGVLTGEVITVTPPTPPTEYSLFGGGAVTAQQNNDSTSVELGMQFKAAHAGVITELHYYRGAGDATDTDVRAGHLWDAAGHLLATVTFTSTPGQVGWQTATLSAPVVIQAGATYTASYRTQDNYLATGGYFATDHVDAFGELTAPGGINGVYVYGTSLVEPTSSYNASNYWVDVSFQLGVPSNAAPVITSGTTYSMAENKVAVGAVTATDSNGDALTYGIAGGADAGLFTINAVTGALSFVAPPNYEAPADSGGNNVYDLIVSVSDNIASAVTKAIQVTVTNVEPETPPPAVVSLFEKGAVTATSYNDNAGLELGMRVTATQAASVTELRYFRAVSDSNDTDVRDGHIWDSAGHLLGTVTFTSTVGQSGWQTATLATAVNIQAGQTYTVSYHTLDNYVATGGYFTTSHTDATGELTAPAGSNGVYAYGSGLTLPAATYGNTNYWVDLGVTTNQTTDTPPVITSSNSFSMAENQLAVGTISATDANGDALTYGIAGGADAARFIINATTGALSFATAPNYEIPTDVGANNIYDLTISVSDGIAAAVTQAIQVTVTNVEPEPQVALATLFGAGDLPAVTVTNDPANYELGTKFVANAAGSVSELRYYRGAADATDTDIRTLHLWTTAGQLLATVTVQSDPGAVGWQVGTLAAPVTLANGGSYIVSYGTTQNYVATNNYFNTSHGGTAGLLTAPSGGNGVFSTGGPGAFPTQTYLNSNYWTDVAFTPDPVGAPQNLGLMASADEFSFALASASMHDHDMAFA